MAQERSYEHDVASLALASVVAHHVGGLFGETLFYIKTHEGWRQFHALGLNRGRHVGVITQNTIPETILRSAYLEGSLSLRSQGVRIGDVVQDPWQLDALPLGSVVSEPEYTELVKLPNGHWTGGLPNGQIGNTGPFESTYTVGILSSGRARWER